jgi:hypothetical protein
MKRKREKNKTKTKKEIRKYKRIFSRSHFLDENNNPIKIYNNDFSDEFHHGCENIKFIIEKCNPFNDTFQIFITLTARILFMKLLNKLFIFDFFKKELILELNNVKIIKKYDPPFIVFEDNSIFTFNTGSNTIENIFSNPNPDLKIEYYPPFGSSSPNYNDDKIVNNYHCEIKDIYIFNFYYAVDKFKIIVLTSEGWEILLKDGTGIPMKCKNIDKMVEQKIPFSEDHLITLSNGIVRSLRIGFGGDVFQSEIQRNYMGKLDMNFNIRLKFLKCTICSNIGVDYLDNIFSIGTNNCDLDYSISGIGNKLKFNSVGICKVSFDLNTIYYTIKKLICLDCSWLIVVAPIIHVNHYKGDYITCSVYGCGARRSIDPVATPKKDILKLKKQKYVYLFRVPERKNFKENLFFDIHRTNDIVFDYFYE